MNLLELRSRIKARKPDFIRQDNPKRMKVGGKWRKPKGVHSKIRHNFKGRRKMPSPGYRSPAQVRGLHSTGMNMIIVNNTNELSALDAKKDGVVVSGKVGMKKRLEILKKSKELKLHVLNINADKHISKINDSMEERKKSRAASKKEEKPKDEKKHPKKDAKHEDKKEESELTDDQKKEAEKKEKDSVLTQKV